MPFFVYIVPCKGEGRKNKGKIRYYTGYTENLEKRLKQHKNTYYRARAGLPVKNNNGSKWMADKKYRPLYIGYVEGPFDSRSEAKGRESDVKKFSHDRKKELVKNYCRN